MGEEVAMFLTEARTARRATITAVLTAFLASGVCGQEPARLALDSLFTAHRQPLDFTDTGLSGPGWEFILEEGARARFVMVGESHNLREIPLFTARLFEVLHERAGYDYLALENGPYAMAQYSAAGVRGSLEHTVALANRYVNALQFRTDQELEMIAAAGRVSTARIDALWGLDQEWGALHVLERLHELAPGPEGRQRLEELIEEARPLEARRPGEGRERFVGRGLTAEALELVRGTFEGAPAEAHRLLDDLRTSVEIYAARRDGPSIYASNHRREQYMRQRFMEQCRAAQDSGDPDPRVVLKFGQWHALRGVLNWGDVEPLGTFIAEIARANGGESLHIWTGLVNQPGHVWTLHDFPDYVPLARAGTTDRWWVVDLRPVRAQVAAGAVDGVNDELRKVIFGFDLALLIGGGNRATVDRLSEGG